ncbi:phosphatase PAP2 family protein [Flavobacterium sp.]|uniref:phosphatase PAP2 family protein n=1 Tax=Flavobacterium sp. TaxID=239 RepID=UPI003752A78B
MHKIIVLLFFLTISYFSIAQNASDRIVKDSIKVDYNKQLKFNYKQLIIPTVFVSYGVIALESDQLKLFNSEIKEEVNEHIDQKITIDDFSQYTPAIAAISMEALGVKGKNSLKDKAIILSTSYIIMGLTVKSLKTATHEQRPDGSDFYSFPSGHTATAFMGAELLYQEYKDVSIWYGISGYLVAAGTGAFRIYNDRHWLNDVVAGAGIGILSTKAAYWLFPTINKLFTNNKSTTKKSAFIPFYNGKTVGFGLVATF